MSLIRLLGIYVPSFIFCGRDLHHCRRAGASRRRGGAGRVPFNAPRAHRALVQLARMCADSSRSGCCGRVVSYKRIHWEYVSAAAEFRVHPSRTESFRVIPSRHDPAEGPAARVSERYMYSCGSIVGLDVLVD